MGKFEKIILVLSGVAIIYGTLLLVKDRNELQRQVYELKLLQKCQDSLGKK